MKAELKVHIHSQRHNCLAAWRWVILKTFLRMAKMQTNTGARISYFSQETNLYWKVCGCEIGEGREKRERKEKEGDKQKGETI